MKIKLQLMNEIHDLQMKMFLELKRVLDILNINYYFIHGSLLGALALHGFIPEDDDIDIAIFRKDYNKLMREGKSLLLSNYYLQTSTTDDFPLSFGKLRNTNTAFIQPVLRNYNCNKGIYIDIFPIDYECKNYIQKARLFLLSKRICSRLLNTDTSFISKLTTGLSYVLFPSYRLAVKKREEIYASLIPTELVSVTNGKATEKRMPIEWFGTGTELVFENVRVKCPEKYHSYLSRIYGQQYHGYNPAEKRISNNGEIEVSADIIDTQISYKSYL